MFKMIYQQEKTLLLQILIFFFFGKSNRCRTVPTGRAAVRANHIVAAEFARRFL